MPENLFAPESLLCYIVAGKINNVNKTYFIFYHVLNSEYSYDAVPSSTSMNFSNEAATIHFLFIKVSDNNLQH